MSDIRQLSYNDHWQEQIINLKRPNIGDKSLGITISGGIDIPFLHHHFTAIIITHIKENSLAHSDKGLKLYDLILRVNDVDLTNIKHQTAVDTLRRSGQKIQLLIRRLSPSISEEIELEHNGKLGISIAGGIGNEYFRDDHGIFITDINKQQTNKQLGIGDRLFQISSTYNTYDLRFITFEIAKERIQLACEESQKIKLFVGHTRPPVRVEKKTVLRQGQYDPLGCKEEDSVQVNKNNYSFVSPKGHDVRTENHTTNREANRRQLIESFDFDDYQRYENRGKFVKNRLLNGGNTVPLKVSLEVEREQPHIIKYATAPTITDLKSHHKVNADVKRLCNTDQHTSFKVDDSHRNVVIDKSAAQQSQLNKAAINEAYAEKERREQSKMNQKSRLSRLGVASGGGGELRWQVD